MVLPLGVQVWYSKYMEKTTRFALGLWLIGFLCLGIAQAIPVPPSVRVCASLENICH